MRRDGRARPGPNRRLRFWIYLGVIALFLFAGYFARAALQVYGESKPVAVPGDPPPTVPEPVPEREKEPEPEPEPEPPRVEFPPPEGEIWSVADGDYLQAVVTKQTTLGRYAPGDLNRIPDDYITAEQRRWDYFLRAEALEQLSRMIETARAEGVTLYVNSAYRSFETQEQLFRDYAAAHGEAAADTFSARPGHSEHQLGTTVDFTGTMTDRYYCLETVTSGDLDEVLTVAGWWLAKNAYRYGFTMSYPPESKAVTGYIYEPWHFRYIGVKAARDWYESGEILFLFLLHRYPQEFLQPGEYSSS